jgi:peptidoglycan/LPS O-acetylase OafA/YrhL
MVGGLIVLVAYAVDLVAGGDLADGVAGAGRAVVIVGAVLCAGVVYQLWSVRKPNDILDHAAVAAALLGGALAASSAFSAPAGQIFRSSLTAAAGVAGLAIALYASRPDRVRTEGSRR